MALNEPFASTCLYCTMTCARGHSASRKSSQGGPSSVHCFCKRVSEHCVEGGPSCWMQVPSQFVQKYLPDVDYREMVLENAEGMAWPVEFTEEHGFWRGWAEFSTTNQLAVDDFLIFSLVEQDKFVVHVFDEAGCEKHVQADKQQTNTTRWTPMATQRHAANPATTAESVPPGFTKASLPNADSEGQIKGKGEWNAFRTPAAQRSSYGVSQEPANLNTAPQTNLSNPDWRPKPVMNSKGRPASSNAYKLQTHSVPAPRTDLMTTSWRGVDGPSTCHNMQLGQQSDLKDKKKEPVSWRLGPTWSQIQARLLVTRAKLRKMNITPLPMSKRRRGVKSNRNSLTTRTFTEILESDGDVGFDASSGYDGGHPHSQRKRRSFSKDDAANDSSLDSLRWPEEDIQTEGDNILRFSGSFCDEIKTEQFSGGPSRQHEVADSFNKIPEYVPEYVRLPRKAGRPRKYPLLTIPQQLRPCTYPESSHEVQEMEVKEKPKRGRPFKHQAPGEFDMHAKPLREIFVSRRRSVTQAEKDEVINAAYAYDLHLKSSTNFIVVMRQSFVYRNFVLGVPRRFAQRYMPDTNVEVTLVDEAWNAWTCSWNAAYKYMSGRGWRNFAVEHCLEEDDALLMEILSETDYTLTIKVYIFRVVPIPDGQTGWKSHVLPPNCYPEPNSGVPIQPMLHIPLKRQPRMRALHRKRSPSRGKRIKREPVYIEESSVSDSSEEFD